MIYIAKNSIDLNNIIPALITGMVAIIGFLVQIFISAYIQKKNKSVNKLNALNSFVLPLQRLLNDLQLQCLISGISYNDLMLSMIDDTSQPISEANKERIINLYSEINNLFLKGNYYYIDQTTHKAILKIRKHVYHTIFILNSKDSSKEILINELEQNALPDLTAFSQYIDTLHKKM